MRASHHLSLAALLAALSVALFVGVGEGEPPPPAKKSPAPKGNKKKAPVKSPGTAAHGKGCFNLLNANATGPDQANTYLLMLANHLIYGDADYPRAFRKRYEATFRGYGMKEIQFVEDARTATRAVVMSTDRAVVVSFRGTEPGSL